MNYQQATKKTHVEKVANIILDAIRSNPDITTTKLYQTIRKNPEFPKISDSMIRQYLKVIHKAGYIQRKGVSLQSYKCLSDTPFKYVPVAFNQKRDHCETP